MDSKLHRLVLAALLTTLSLPGSPSRADSYPSRPIRVVIPAPPGGTSDVYARKLGEKLSQSLGQPVIIDSRPGAAGNIAADIVAKAKPDGYTLLFGHIGISAINPWVYSKLSYDAGRDLMPITQIGRLNAIVVVNAQLPAKTLGELIALAKSKPGQLAYGSAGVGSPQHVTGELFKVITGVDMLHVPYKGSTPVIAALIGGEIQVGFEYPIVVAPQMQGGRIRALAIAGPKRLPILPDVPTAAEASLPGFESEGWTGYFAPTGTPRAIIDHLYREIAKAALSADFSEFMKAQGSDVVASTPEEFAEFVKSERAKWGKIVKTSGARIE